MNKLVNKRRQRFANKLHRQTFILVVAAAAIPTMIITIGLFYLIFGITASEIGIPEAIHYNIVPAAKKVVITLSVIMPIIILAVYFILMRFVLPKVGIPT